MWTCWDGFNTWLTHCSDRKHKQQIQFCCCNWRKCQRWRHSRWPTSCQKTSSLSFRLTCEPQLKLTAQVRVAAGFFPPDLHQELIFPAAGGRHRRAGHGVTLWERPVTAKCLVKVKFRPSITLKQRVYNTSKKILQERVEKRKFVLTTSVLWAAGQSAVTNHQPVPIIARRSFAVTDGHVALWQLVKEQKREREERSFNGPHVHWNVVIFGLWN